MVGEPISSEQTTAGLRCMMRLQRSGIGLCAIAVLQIENPNPQEVAALWPHNRVSACDRLRYFLRYWSTL